MNAPDLSTAALAELAPVTGTGGPARPGTTPGRPAVVDPELRSDEAPDAEIAIGDTLVRVHAMFQVDPTTKEVHVSVVDDRGRLIRMIPPDSVAQMLAAMASYANRI